MTRFKCNAGLDVVRQRRICQADRDVVLGDEIVSFKNRHPGGGRPNAYEKPLRRITIARADHEQPMVLATNDLKSSAATIAQHYKDRWQIELFFKWIKQHLRIKTFFGRSENAVRIQILTALITYLLLAIYRKAHGATQSLWIVLCELRTTLFQRPGLDAHLYEKRKRRRETLMQLQPSLFN